VAKCGPTTEGGAPKTVRSPFTKLFVIVAGSVEVERLFSAASFVLSKHRRRLHNSLVELVRDQLQGVFSLDDFPYERALDMWNTP
jgi:hypothetical protein